MPNAISDEFDLDIRLGATGPRSDIEAATVRTSSPTTGERVCCTDYCCTV